MNVKYFEIRDRGTFIPVMAVKLRPQNEAERYLMGRAGYGRTPEVQSKYILLSRIDGGEGKVSCDEHGWGAARTMGIAHGHIINNFDSLEHGQVIDVEFILGETPEPKVSEAKDSYVF